MFFKKEIDSKTGKKKTQTTTCITMEYKLKDNDEIFRRKNVSGFRRKGSLFVIFIYIPGKEHFDQIIVPLNTIEWTKCYFIEQPVYGYSKGTKENDE